MPPPVDLSNLEAYCRSNVLSELRSRVRMAHNVLAPKECDQFVTSDLLRIDSLLFYYSREVRGTINKTFAHIPVYSGNLRT